MPCLKVYQRAYAASTMGASENYSTLWLKHYGQTHKYIYAIKTSLEA